MGSGGKFCSFYKEDCNNMGLWKASRWKGLDGEMEVLIRTKQDGHTCFLSSGTILSYMLVLSWKQAFDPCMRNIYVSSRGFTLVTVEKERISLPHFIHLFLPVLQYPLKEQIHLRMFILSWYSGLKSFSICFCPAFCRWQHLSESQCRLLIGFVPSEMGYIHHHYNFTESGGMMPRVNLTLSPSASWSIIIHSGHNGSAFGLLI